MKTIPKRLKIGGLWFDIGVRDCSLNVRDGEYVFGASNLDKQKIWIAEGGGQQQNASTLLHEILEVINMMYELKLEHRDICVLESALFQVFLDNGLNWGE